MSVPHISVCVCTYRRPVQLANLLESLARLQTNGAFSYDIVVCDNDVQRSAEAVVQRFAGGSNVPVVYCVEPEANIAKARNAAVASAVGDFVAFIDDDEMPTPGWLRSALEVIKEHRADGALGPVLARFDHEPAAWMTKGKFFDRPRYRTGRSMNWTEARTGNALLSKRLFDALSPPFRTHFATAGEDVDFFRRAIDQGFRFIWCDEAVVFELIPPQRCTRRYLLRRALLRGSNFPKHPTDRALNVLKSAVALPCYTLALPILALSGQHVFMNYLIKLCDHSSRLLAFAGLPLVTDRGVLEQ